MIVKTINDISESDDLMLTLLIFDVYSRMHVMNSSISSINQRAMIIEKVMIEVRKFRAERQVSDVLNIRNESIIISIHDLSLNSNVLIWRESNNQRDKWTESFKFLNIDDEICKIELSSESIDFRSIVIKSYLVESIVDVQSINKNFQSINSFNDENQNFASEISTRLIRTRRLFLRYQNFADIIVFLQDDVDSSSSTFALTSNFVESRRKEINDLLKRQVFEIITISEVSKNVRIFNFRFVDEIKHSDISQTYEKFKLMIQIYNDHEKILMLTQAFIIQRMSQRIILVITASMNDCHLYLKDITQTYSQSKSLLNRMFFIRSSFDLNLFDDVILRIIKSLYDVSEAKTHWFNIYHTHHKEKLIMMKFTYDSCLLFINRINQNKSFEMIKMQTDDILMLKNDQFAELKENELKKAKLTSKKRKILITLISIKFNDEIISIDSSINVLLLNQSKQFDQIRLINISISIDLISSRDQIKKSIISKDQYVTQRARETYIATMSQSEVNFDLSLAVQVTNSKKEDAKRLNKRLQWQLDHSIRELNFVPLNINSLKLMIFIDVFFANVNLHSQIDYVICLIDDLNKTNIIHWFFTKCKRMIRSVLAAKLYAMTNEFDADSVIKSIIQRILKILSLSMILLTDSRSLYDCLIKLDTTSEKRLMIDLMCLRQSYERREITKIRWIDEDTNSIDAMTKINSCQALTKLIDTNIIDLRTTAWVKRMNERTTKNEEIIQKRKTISSLSSDVSVWSKDFINQIDWW